VNLRRRFIAYILVVHALMAGGAAYVLSRDRLWLVAVEAVFALTLIWGVLLVTRLSAALSSVREGSQLLNDGEFTTRFLEAGHPDVDLIVGVYNRMVDSLRDERVRLEEQQYFLGRLLEVSPSGVVILDHDGRVSMVNAAAGRLLKTESESLNGQHLAAGTSQLGRALAEVEPGDSRIVALQGGRRVRCQCASFVERGFPRRFYLIEELTEELRQTEKSAYEKLIRMMSHEVNNSVGATRSLLQSSLTYGAALGAEPRAEFEQAVAVATARLERLNTFMRSFADVVRVPEPSLQPVAAEALVEGCVRLMEAQADARRVAWRWDRQGTIGDIAMDAAQMEQALINVLKNAREAAGDGGTVTVRLRSAPEPAIEVEDSGPGVPDAVRDALFTPFFTTKQNGQGIGLTLVQEILRRHGFDYALDTPAGGPTRFRIVLRRADA
jgi:two-component system, NtrC family, nitrogen regulation sensor histidine kinase NtrY